MGPPSPGGVAGRHTGLSLLTAVSGLGPAVLALGCSGCRSICYKPPLIKIRYEAKLWDTEWWTQGFGPYIPALDFVNLENFLNKKLKYLQKRVSLKKLNQTILWEGPYQ